MQNQAHRTVPAQIESMASGGAMYFGSSPIGALTPWRVCSGFAHGRLWATLAVLPREVVDLPTPADVGSKVTNSLDRLIWATMAAVDVANVGLHLYRTRAASPYAPD